MADLTLDEIRAEVRKRAQAANQIYEAVPEARKGFHAGSIAALESLIDYLEYEPEPPTKEQVDAVMAATIRRMASGPEFVSGNALLNYLSNPELCRWLKPTRQNPTTAKPRHPMVRGFFVTGSGASKRRRRRSRTGARPA